jgi:hypothetical protein
MAKYKIPRDPVFKTFGIFNTLSGTYICPGWIQVDPGTTREDVEYTDDIIYKEKQIALEVTSKSQIDLEFKVPSSNGKSEYLVKFKQGDWSCNCPASTFRRGNCKHIKEIETNQKSKV